MSKIIITLTNKKRNFEYDLEVPVDLEYKNLIDDIIQTVISFNPDLRFIPAKSRLIIVKHNFLEMHDGDTLESLGVFNGDYLLLEQGD